MTGAERGFLLLASHLGNPERRPLTTAQMRNLSKRATMLSFENRDLGKKDFLLLGYSHEMAERILELLSEEALLDYALTQGSKQDCCPISRINEHYPKNLSQRLGLDAPSCLWVKGDVTLLGTSAIALVGSRQLREPNRAFAAAVGEYAAHHGLTLISGNARGADRTAQDACLAAGGNVICFVADELGKQPLQEHILYLSEEDFDAPFTIQRALSRNRCIHALGETVFVAQSDLGSGGTWGGCTHNLRKGWSPMVCFRDGSEAVAALVDLGACTIGLEELAEFSIASVEDIKLF